MRLAAPLTLAAAAVLLAACGKSASSGGAASPPPPAAAPATNQSADLENGEAKIAVCKSCHTLQQGGGAMVGPNLYGVFGRKAGAVEGFAYSDGLKASGIVWDADKINQWIKGPSAMIPGTKMTYIGMADAKDRADVVAYLKVATSAAK